VLRGFDNYFLQFIFFLLRSASATLHLPRFAAIADRLMTEQQPCQPCMVTQHQHAGADIEPKKRRNNKKESRRN